MNIISPNDAAETAKVIYDFSDILQNNPSVKKWSNLNTSLKGINRDERTELLALFRDLSFEPIELYSALTGYKQEGEIGDIFE